MENLMHEYKTGKDDQYNKTTRQVRKKIRMSPDWDNNNTEHYLYSITGHDICGGTGTYSRNTSLPAQKNSLFSLCLIEKELSD